ncbi:MAG: prepilin-type N-terminal cleavage/methylation domain-containing protein [Kordiimonadaceae bacterium]|nr:prepilin-type N-terminal cleavage/methylation domain-containing protein [Kordiimonadaceae bacterium]MBO6568090.1 prepilin-type N-terminal cleavage/methylation domain-containing protein [Kordiimonadaceae bacterium]MBO6964180.1 prepilin-type N-terminal cleavage/methylation domain-containing protein [Kordiimonadaceae bacterium]
MQELRADRGFSLVEVMMVVAIIGLMASAVVLSLPNESRDVRQSMSRLEHAFIALSRDSVLSGRVIGVVFSRGGFETVALSDDGWTLANGTLKPEARRWQSLILASLQVEGADVSFAATALEPQIWFLPTGEHPSYELSFEGAGTRAKLFAAVNASPEVRYEN